ncbi:MAG TPA: hypothetical protein VGC39_07765 [Candidatus Methylacidiphilales bacterium]
MSLHCALSSPAACTPGQCRCRCALEVIDELLCEHDSISGDEADQLLDLRWKLGRREDAEMALRLFCDLRIRMEQRHYLAFFRIRRWLESYVLASVHTASTEEAELFPVKLDHYCVEAIRRMCLCQALAKQSGSLTGPLGFVFRLEEPSVKEDYSASK